MLQSLTVQEVHASLCEILNFEPSEVYFTYCAMRPGHGRMETLHNTKIFNESIFRYVNESSHLLVFKGSTVMGSLHLHESSIWFDAQVNSKLEDQAIVELYSPES